jgi:hypothetical protein
VLNQLSAARGSGHFRKTSPLASDRIAVLYGTSQRSIIRIAPTRRDQLRATAMSLLSNRR